MEGCRVVMAGTGNASTVLGRLVLRSGHSIVRVCGRDPVKAGRLAEEWGSEASTSFDLTEVDADLCIVAVSDRALKDCGRWLRVGGALTVHTAGSVEMGVLRSSAQRHGVLYPLQSLNANASAPTQIPFLVDGCTEEVCSFVSGFARSLSPLVSLADDRARADTHLAAVMSSNFINHLLALTEDLCRSRGVSFSTLRPLLNETLERAFRDSPSEVQTGPAARNDLETVGEHLRKLEDMPAIRETYLALTKSILDRMGFDDGPLRVP